VSQSPDESTGAERPNDPSAAAAAEPAAPKATGKRASLRSPNEALQPEAAPPPPEDKKKKRRDSLSGTISGVVSFVVIVGLLLMGVAAYGIRRYDSPGPLPADKIVLIPQGAGVADILDQLEREGVVSDALILRGAVYTQNLQGKVRAGEFLFKANASPREVLQLLLSGKSIQHALTIPEGLTSEQIVQRVRDSDVLIGDVREVPKEGWLAPQTYNFSRGMTREQFLTMMRKHQQELLDQVWAKRATDLPLKSPAELLTLASIVEKETGKAEERPRVASVFVNRLNKRMRLQSDPTIVYGLVGGKGSLGRGITRSELTRPTVYNTYVIDGLPPGPIANPGKASLEAVANPMRTNDLYFVADGTGGHVFAASLADHNRNVQRWRSIERDTEDRATDDPPAAEAPSPAAPVGRPQRRGALDGENTFGALPARLGLDDAARAAVTAGPDMAGAARRVMGRSRAAAVEPSRDWAPRMALAFAPAPTAAVGHAAGAKAIEAAAPASATAHALDRAAPDDLAAQSAEPQAGAASASPYAFKSVADDFQIVGVTTTAGYLDIEPDPEKGAPPSSLASFPMSAASQADLRARMAQYGGLPATGGVKALPIIDAPPAQADASAPAAQPKRPRVVDASEGTALDPLKNTTWDLNSPKTIPELRVPR
jgi:UPF0755 protein